MPTPRPGAPVALHGPASGPVLVVEAPEALAMMRACRKPPEVVTTRFASLRAPLLERVKPRCIVFWLFASGFDSFALLRRLERQGYRGRVLVLSPPLPNRAMVLAEARREAKSLRLHLLTLPQT